MSDRLSTQQKPTIPEVLPLVHALYQRHSVGCCLHIVLDDFNINDSDVQYCVELANERQHEECGELARLLLDMSKTQRKKLSALAYAS